MQEGEVAPICLHTTTVTTYSLMPAKTLNLQAYSRAWVQEYMA